MTDDKKQMPNEVRLAISNILKFLEKSEKDFLSAQKSDKTGQEEAEYENS